MPHAQNVVKESCKTVKVIGSNMNEYQLQNKLAHYLLYTLKHRFITPNSTMMFQWECDLVSVTNAGYMHEFEIKRTRADFKADKNKRNKHLLLEEKHKPKAIPNYFWYVCHDFKIDISDIPDYAGLIIIGCDRYDESINVIKKAPRLSTNKISDYRKGKLYEAIFYRYWNERSKK